MANIPLNDAFRLVREFGLLINQVSVYGIAHKVIEGQAVAFFNSLIQLVTRYAGVEFSIQGEKLAVNGSSDGIDQMTMRNLKEKMMLQKLPNIAFLPILTQCEFLTFLSYLGTPPVKIQEQGGFAVLLKEANIKGIRIDHVVVKYVSAKTMSRAPAPNAWIIGEKTAEKPVDPSQLVLAQGRIRRKQVQAELDSLLSEVAQLISSNSDPESEEQNQKVVVKLRSIRDTLRKASTPSKEHILTLHGQSNHPASEIIRTDGLAQKLQPLRLTHKEYMERYAELTQEIAQPLTVTNGVIELLRKGQAGSLNETQTQFLNLALDSVDRVNQLIKYMHTLSGEPESYLPDAKIVKETYI
ncbi:MAG: histidine kinase dimerization/phospho-acceptor domain-containing protein [bacterium]